MRFRVHSVFSST